ncbi:MAG: TIGR02281 family clan AA aspartic protease [Rhizobiaceae bacterium]
MKTVLILSAILGIGAILLLANHDADTLFGLPNDRFASLVYLTIFGTMIAASMLGRRNRLRETMRNAVVWLGLILALMAAHVHRYELQDIASRVTAGIVPGSPVSQHSPDGRTRIMLVRDADGHFSARAMVNGARLPMLIDTGASMVVLTTGDAEAAGIDVAALSFSSPVSTANGVTTAARITLDEILIGDITRTRVPAMVAQPGALKESLLGMSFLSSLTAFEFRGERMILTD